MINVFFIDDEMSPEEPHQKVWQNKLDKTGEVFFVKVYSNPTIAFEEKENFLYNTIIVLDLQMPGFDGDKFLHKIRENNIHIPVIIYSGNVKIEENETILTLIKDNIFSYIEKPNRDEVVNAIVNASKMLKDIVPLEVSEALQEYINRDPNRKNIIVTTKDEATITTQEIIEEINKKTPFGISYTKALYKMSFESLLNEKK
ncbi:response regulator [Sulfurimonas sp. NWX367]|uniref:response regulator n=1 Tax=Sulfurimonas sp. NWX367 TaxID=2925413 RepID=UPI003204B1AF